MSRIARWARPRVFTAVLLALLASVLAAAAPAQASHLKGASIDAQIDATGQLTGSVSLISANYGDCDNPYPEIGSVTYTAPGGSPTSISLNAASVSACTPGSVTASATFSVSVAGETDGEFILRQQASARVSGIQNSAPSTITVNARVKKEAGFTHRTPRITSQPALGISTLAAYSQQLAASVESGSASFALMQSADNTNTATYDSTSPATNLVSISGTGLVGIPFSTTAGLTVGHYYVYKVRVSDSAGQYTERDLLLTVSNNAPPVFSGDSASGVIDVKPGVPTTLNFTATDPDVGQTLTMAVGGVPAWGSSTTGSGTASVSLNAPESAVGTATQIAVDATDSDINAPMTSARTVTVRVVANTPEPKPEPKPEPTPDPAPVVAKPAAPKLLSSPPTTTTSRDAEITWSGEAGGNYTCVVNNKPAASCSSPLKLSGLAPGRHTVKVFQTNASGDGQILEVSWVVTEARLDVGAKLAVKADDLTVGCKVAGVNIERCIVDVYAVVTGQGGKARAAKRVKIGTGEFKTNKTTNAVDIELTLNATGKRLVNRLGGVKVTLDMTAWPKGGGAQLKASGKSTLLPSRVKVTPATGIFAHQSAKLTPAARAWVAATAKQLGTAKSIRCTGHTARSGRGIPEANRRLGLARAKAICGALKRAGVKVKTTTATAGETRPRSSNRTLAGRAENRRVELLVTYQR